MGIFHSWKHIFQRSSAADKFDFIFFSTEQDSSLSEPISLVCMQTASIDAYRKKPRLVFCRNPVLGETRSGL